MSDNARMTSEMSRDPFERRVVELERLNPYWTYAQARAAAQQERETRWSAFTDDELAMIVSWKQSLDAAVRTGDRRYEPDDSFGEAIEAELERRREAAS